MKIRNLYILMAFVWLIIIAGFTASKEYTLRYGVEVTLKTVPIDPRDLFRGDYIVLRYNISDIDRKKYAYYSNLKAGDTVYVTLNIENNQAEIKSLFLRAPKDQLFIKGKIKTVYPNHWTVDYGIESYFLPEGKGWPIENERGKGLTVRVSIDRFGNAVIKHLEKEGKKIVFE